MALLKINGREHFIDANTVNLTQTKPGHYALTYDGRSVEIIGGFASGGGRNEWCFKNEVIYGDRWMRATSLVDAVKKAAVH